ncbi:mitochondrial distribution and morphology protein 34 [Plectosphaerella plurivora]|uniref:Mitochondrial distribution and morphology protein 34 n=1 Tax=Plectosphaerella plurivora TaxID=936078 RepID=A0A9P8VHE6_9PEZI|nr:mitochondrial distribution and morphology protein 34 [Plectosphaerella plurivora]
MAFNFNWSPLAADEDFYQRARDLLTTALNKSPKPPIIVDDIFVTELNLGSVPPDLEILEIGDLAEDRFRGIFKMSYSGDAFLTLKTRVQANPMNTYLSSKPSFTSPQPLAAASGLTIPLSITLSEIKLSAFIILVFSRQKGLTLVFRNDPLESLKVSSTFDSIQFVRDYLQRTIESKLRTLMMDELPAIIHRLSLQLWCPDSVPKTTEVPREDEAVVDPLASPPQDPVDAHGNLLDANEISSLSLEGGPEVQSLFSQKNLLRLGALNDSHRTFSLFTPGIRDVVFRAWTGQAVSDSATSTPPTATPCLSKSNSFAGPVNSTTYTFSDTGSAAHGHLPSRPSLVSLGSAAGLSMGSSNRPRSYVGRKKKTRVVNLRRTKSEAGTDSEAGETNSDSASVAGPSTDSPLTESIPEEPEEHELSASTRVRFNEPSRLSRPPLVPGMYQAPVEVLSAPITVETPRTEPVAQSPAPERPLRFSAEKVPAQPAEPAPAEDWIMKMAGEIARRVYDEKNRQQPPTSLWDDREEMPPPAYEAAH